ncbi:phosphate ABC transporter/ phosphate-binding protein PstS [Synechococcus sp. Minos11]|uniref:phosphate ABC transporter substrate-binding protein PstS n=1 Tax=Synechococcus sp. Minos11 TaxID=221341 RepID=UPI000E087E5A|nr:phosphate ABC transporter substrate-binding protein PstS [Synechococcus sp. Minos11]QNJ08933.1 phosphate ABC transporter/ phosphate-binding protein PstS [Synechococcus sp. Minos11]RCL63361.1 MAG: phosphate ABC transporter substrate-binding protein PstS [Synechococcus sp. MED-G67]HCV57652.1 phosphate ABC transporter substrate-binding protein PstS [Synechococcales bacterium UBA12195]|tara:strand:+ start:769 stop:1755 length:987 start_codon:yes stop_codon:yes gene_type:complete
MPVTKKAVALSSLVALSAAAIAPAIAQQSLNGAGASFPAPLYQKWFQELAAAGGPKVNYQAVGSGAGVRQMIAGTSDFGASDKPLGAKKRDKIKRGVIQIPMTGGTIAVGYNKPGCTLKLTQKQVAEIFLGKITDYSQLGCAAGPITVAYRSDGSGTTFAFTNAVAAWNGDFKDTIGVGKSVNWPVGSGGKGNSGVAGVIQNTPGGLGYVNQAYVKGKIKAAAIQNKDGNYVKPTSKNGSAGLAGIKLDAYNTGTDTNPSGANAYPISTLTWILAYASGNGDNTPALKKTFAYMLSNKAQSQAPSLGYVPLPSSIRKISLAAVQKIAN